MVPKQARNLLVCEVTEKTKKTKLLRQLVLSSCSPHCTKKVEEKGSGNPEMMKARKGQNCLSHIEAHQVLNRGRIDPT